MISPAFLGLGILIFLYGCLRESRRRRRLGTKEAMPYPTLNLNDARQRKIFTFVLAGGSLLAILLSFVGYNAYLFTDSNTFCGKLCHSVMKPEYTSLPERSACTGALRRLPCGFRGIVVCEVEDLGGSPGFCRLVSNLLQTDSCPYHKPAPRP